MTISPIKNQALGYNLADSTKAKERLDKNTMEFLNLLMTELKYQDPYEPMNAKEMAAQLIQMNGVEQSINTNKNLEKLINLTEAASIDHQVAYLGKKVATLHSTNDAFMKVENGKAHLKFNLPSASDKVFVTIRDQYNQELYQGQIQGVPGSNLFSWDNNLATNPLTDGEYKINITALDPNDTPMDVKMLKAGLVTSATLENGKVHLILDDNAKIAADHILEVSLDK